MNPRVRSHVDQITQALLAVGSAVLILVGSGIVDAQTAPPFPCGGANKDGCEATGCVNSTGQCSSQNWFKEQRLNYKYRDCVGAANVCVGWNTDYVTCKNLFFDAAHATCPINVAQCTLTTTTPACPGA